MTVIGFEITFHTMFRVGSAYAEDGVDAAVDRDDPLPADHLKGVMRAAAEDLLSSEHGRVKRVFGSSRAPSPWSWVSADPSGPERWRFDRRHRVKIDESTRSAVKDHLVLGEQVWASKGRFEVHATGVARADREEQVTLLRVAASAVHGLGAWRRRGLGWVGIAPESGRVTEGEVAQVLQWRREK